MNILLTNHQMATYGGSEIFTYELAKELKKQGHTPVIYSPYIEIFKELLAKENIRLVAEISMLKDEDFDIAHVQHNICALEVRQMFRHLPIFFLAHGPKAFLETPPALDVNITKWGAISQRVLEKNLQEHGVQTAVLVNNIVNRRHFYPRGEAKKHVLIISHQMEQELQDRIEQACTFLGYTVEKIGRPHKVVPNYKLPHYINKAQIVFTLGRGAIETMICGRVPFILDQKGSDGLVTLENYDNLASVHFNGKFFSKDFSVAEIVKEMQQWQPDLGRLLRMRTVKDYSPIPVVKNLVKIYQATIAQYRSKPLDWSLLDFVVQTVQVTRQFTVRNLEPIPNISAVKKPGSSTLSKVKSLLFRS